MATVESATEERLAAWMPTCAEFEKARARRARLAERKFEKRHGKYGMFAKVFRERNGTKAVLCTGAPQEAARRGAAATAAVNRKATAAERRACHGESRALVDAAAERSGGGGEPVAEHEGNDEDDDVLGALLSGRKVVTALQSGSRDDGRGREPVAKEGEDGDLLDALLRGEKVTAAI
eukprot:1712556-Prymnesium_polylepis.2